MVGKEEGRKEEEMGMERGRRGAWGLKEGIKSCSRGVGSKDGELEEGEHGQKMEGIKIRRDR